MPAYYTYMLLCYADIFDAGLTVPLVTHSYLEEVAMWKYRSVTMFMITGRNSYIAGCYH